MIMLMSQVREASLTMVSMPTSLTMDSPNSPATWWPATDG